ncbi:RNA polymerase Rpb1 domain 1, partial [Trinorchestia longiramus]
GGLIDAKMGTTEPGYLCATCGLDMTGCVGHFGHIELARPLFHVAFIGKVKKVLECVCFYCSRLKV